MHPRHGQRRRGLVVGVVRGAGHGAGQRGVAHGRQQPPLPGIKRRNTDFVGNDAEGVAQPAVQAGRAPEVAHGSGGVVQLLVGGAHQRQGRSHHVLIGQGRRVFKNGTQHQQHILVVVQLHIHIGHRHAQAVGRHQVMGGFGEGQALQSGPQRSGRIFLLVLNQAPLHENVGQAQRVAAAREDGLRLAGAGPGAGIIGLAAVARAQPQQLRAQAHRVVQPPAQGQGLLQRGGRLRGVGHQQGHAQGAQAAGTGGVGAGFGGQQAAQAVGRACLGGQRPQGPQAGQQHQNEPAFHKQWHRLI